MCDDLFSRQCRLEMEEAQSETRPTRAQVERRVDAEIAEALLKQAENTLDKRFDDWVHTPHGGKVANKFIRLAIGLKRGEFKTFGAKAIVERVRWNMVMRSRDEEGYKINNSYVSRLSRFAETRCPELKGFFRMRELRS